MKYVSIVAWRYLTVEVHSLPTCLVVTSTSKLSKNWTTCLWRSWKAPFGRNEYPLIYQKLKQTLQRKVIRHHQAYLSPFGEHGASTSFGVFILQFVASSLHRTRARIKGHFRPTSNMTSIRNPHSIVTLYLCRYFPNTWWRLILLPLAKIIEVELAFEIDFNVIGYISIVKPDHRDSY